MTAEPLGVEQAHDDGAYTIRNMDWDDLPRLATAGSDGPDPWNYDDLARVIESNYTLGVVCATPSGPAGYMVYVVSDGTGKAARKAGKMHLGGGIVRIQVAKEWRNRGVGRFLVDSTAAGLIRQFSNRAATGRLRLHCTVNETWTPSLLFLKAIGFKTPADAGKAIRHRAFGGDCPDDAIIMERFTPWPDAPPPPA